MPVICGEATGWQWLEHYNGAPSLLRPWPVDLMQAHNVSNLVSTPENGLSGMDQAARAGLLLAGTIAARLGPAVVNISRTTRTDTGSHIVPVWVRRS